MLYLASKAMERINLPRKIIPIGGGLLRLGETKNIDHFIVKESSKKTPHVLFIPTASNDLSIYSKTFKSAYRKLGCRVQSLNLTARNISNNIIQKKICSSDIIYVGGGNLDLLISTWKKFKLSGILKKAYRNGVILTGLSAGCGIWYEDVIERDKTGEREIIKKGLGLISGISLPHYKKNRDKILFSDETKKNYSGKLITAVGDRNALLYLNENLAGGICEKGTKYNVFTISSPYVKKNRVKLFKKPSSK